MMELQKQGGVGIVRGREALLKAEQVAELLNVRVSTVYEWVRMDYIPHIRIGIGLKKPCVRFSSSAIDEWLLEKGRKGRKTRLPVE
ncbi:MAG: DNA-binding protein [Acidobacteria bacterium]|nr:MAG: DNA-binding protein [Acidobacteriota bacterium]